MDISEVKPRYVCLMISLLYRLLSFADHCSVVPVRVFLTYSLCLCFCFRILFYLLPTGMLAGQTLVFSLFRDQFLGFCPTWVTCCTDGGEIWCEGSTYYRDGVTSRGYSLVTINVGVTT